MHLGLSCSNCISIHYYLSNTLGFSQLFPIKNLEHNGLVHGIFLRNLKISPCFVNILLFESINIYCELEVLVEVWVEVLLDDLCLDDLMCAGQQVHPHEWVALAKRVHLLEALALHHSNIETASRVVIANLKLILFLCSL